MKTTKEVPIFKQTVTPHYIIWFLRAVLLIVYGLLFLVVHKNPFGIAILISMLLIASFLIPTQDFYIYPYKMVKTLRIGFDFIRWNKVTLFEDILNISLECHVFKIPRKTTFGNKYEKDIVEVALIELRNGKKFKLSELILRETQLQLKYTFEKYQETLAPNAI